MQTNFSLAQLADPKIATAEKILRTCVHCGFCTATCPTYVLIGDELDSPRGRIYLMKDMFENNRPATEEVVKHVDRCLSCLSCMTTCPSGVHYMHLVDHARTHIEETYRRPFLDRAMRMVLANTLPYPNRFRLALAGAWLAKRVMAIASLVPWPGRLATSGLRLGMPLIVRKTGILPRTLAMLSLAPSRLPARSHLDEPRSHHPQGNRVGRVALLQGCVQPVLQPSINEATVRLLTRLGIEVVIPKGEGCCGSLVHHLGREHESLEQARRNVDVWTKEMDSEGLDAIIITASGCGTTIKDYGFMLRDDPAYAEKAARVSAITRDITEYLRGIDSLKPVREVDATVAYHSACSMQHGQQIKDAPKDLLRLAGLRVKEPLEPHLCCGSAGVYNIMQPQIADALRDRKVLNLQRTRADIIAAGNIGCITQLSKGLADQPVATPVLHTVELLDWLTGGPLPEALAQAGWSVDGKHVA